MKTLDDAANNQDLIDRRIIERNGVSGGVTHAVKIGDRAEIHVYAEYFDQRAKELGFINGYRWGVKYKSDCKRPNLTDDVVVCIENGSIGYSVDGWDWPLIKSFKIIDPRYKPQDTSYLHKPTVIGIDMAGGKDESVEHVVQGDSDWYDYESQKALRLPPVGAECLTWFDDGKECWQKCKVLALSPYEQDHMAVSLIGRHDRKLVWSHDFMPLDHATRKAELEKKRVVAEAVSDVWQTSKSKCTHASAEVLLSDLYDAGYLRLPPEKN